MKLRDFLFEDPGYAPTTTSGSNHHMNMPLGSRGAMEIDRKPPHWSGGVPEPAHLPGTPMYFEHGVDSYEAMRYRHFMDDSIVEAAKQRTAKDKLGNKLPVEIQHDTEKGDYVASVRGGRFRKMASGNERQPIRAIGTGKTPDAAIKALEKKLRESTESRLTRQEIARFGTRAAKRKLKKTDERKLKPDYEPQGRDAQVLNRLQNGKTPGVAPEGKGYCFLCANGTLHAFKFKNDAARWLKADERNIRRAWFGDPIAPSGKFRIRVRDRYSKTDESVEGFGDFLARRSLGVAEHPSPFPG